MAGPEGIRSAADEALPAADCALPVAVKVQQPPDAWELHIGNLLARRAPPGAALGIPSSVGGGACVLGGPWFRAATRCYVYGTLSYTLMPPCPTISLQARYSPPHRILPLRFPHSPVLPFHLPGRHRSSLFLALPPPPARR